MTDWKPHHKVLTAVGILAALGVIYGVVKADRIARIGAGYKAKITCSEIFVAGRDGPEVIRREFLGMPATMKQIHVNVDYEAKTVRASGPIGLGGIKAIYRDGYGCTLANAGRVGLLPAVKPSGTTSAPWPLARPISGEALEYVDYGAVDYALTQAFEENVAQHRSFLVVVDGKIVDEMYADGFNEDTPLLSWSMAKSVTTTLVGAAVYQGYLDVSAPAPVPEWEGDSEKSQITWDDLLRMQSGLEFEEDYEKPRSEVNRMLFERPDAGGFAAQSDIAHDPGEVWSYSSGTANIIARTLRQVLSEQGVDFYQFARDALFEPIGAESFVLEPDASGSFVGSSFAYATPRDWARLGQLYLDQGVWDGVRVLPEGWSDYVASPTDASDGQYGAQFWLNHDGTDGRERFIPGLPEDVYFMSGHEGQYVLVVPDKNLVMVRMGMTRGRSPLPEIAPLFRDVYDAIGYGGDRDRG